MILREIPFDLIAAANRGDKEAQAKVEQLDREYDARVKAAWEALEVTTPSPPAEAPTSG